MASPLLNIISNTTFIKFNELEEYIVPSPSLDNFLNPYEFNNETISPENIPLSVLMFVTHPKFLFKIIKYRMNKCKQEKEQIKLEKDKLRNTIRSLRISWQNINNVHLSGLMMHNEKGERINELHNANKQYHVAKYYENKKF